MSIQKKSIIWNNISIQISYDDDWSNAYKEIYGEALAHLKIESQNRQPLPITETGFKSHFIVASEIADNDSAENYVRAWLNSEAKSKKWKTYFDESKQLSLF